MKMVDPKTEKKAETPQPKVEETVAPEEKQTGVPMGKDNYYPITDLPSKFKLYPEGTKLLGRPLKVLELKLLSTMNVENANSVINDILRKTIRGIDVNDILMPDKLYLVFWLRHNTYKDSGYKVGFECKKCDSESTYSFSLEDLTVKYLPDNFDPMAEIKLPISGHSITISYQKVKDENAIERFKESIKSNPLLTINDELIAVANSINTVDGKEHSLRDKYEYVLDMIPGDYSRLETEVKKLDIGINPDIKVTCDKCGGITPVGVSFRADFFIPSNSA